MSSSQKVCVVPRDRQDDSPETVASESPSISGLGRARASGDPSHAAVAAWPGSRKTARGAPNWKATPFWRARRSCLLAFLGHEDSELARRYAAYLVEKQLPEGGWAMYPGGGVEISGSVKAYFALKLTGHDPSAEYMQRARAAILAHGGADAVNSFTRYLPGPAWAKFPTSSARPCRRKSCCCPSGSR